MCTSSVVSVSQFFRSTIPQDTLNQLAVLYCNIWKEEPWNEDFWKPEYVADDIMLELAREDATAFLALVCDKVVGFTHGYSVDVVDMRKIAGNNQLDVLFAPIAVGGGYYTNYLFDSENESTDVVTQNTSLRRYFYIDELGVDAAYRGKYVGKQLTYALLAYAETRYVDGVILRTDVLAVAARALYIKAGFTEIPVRDENHPTRTYWVKKRSQFSSRVSGFDYNPHVK